MKNINPIIDQFQTSIFSTMSALSQKHGAINLSQGFPDFRGPDFLMESAQKHISDLSMDKNQYAPSKGIPSLRQVLAKRAREDYKLDYCPETEILITNGATEAIFISLLTLCSPGDEVIVFEPFYDSYGASIQVAGAVARYARLEGPDYSPVNSHWESLINAKTKAVILNSPHNPTGRVLTQEELEAVAKIVIEHDLYLIADEVYERLIFDDGKHIPIATLPGMRERTIMISSAGKTFGATGWKIGWIYAPEKLAHGLHMIHQFNTFSVATPLQWAVAQSLEEPHNYFRQFREHYQKLRDLFIQPLQSHGYAVNNPQGSYFCLVETPSNFKDDMNYCQYLIEQIGVSAIPCSAFYHKDPPEKSSIRFCFAKKEETLKEALSRLLKNGR